MPTPKKVKNTSDIPDTLIKFILVDDDSCIIDSADTETMASAAAFDDIDPDHRVIGIYKLISYVRFVTKTEEVQVP